MDDTAFERIEMRIAFLERANQELSDVVYRQQREIDALRMEISAYHTQFEHWKTTQETPASADEKPPHY